MAQSYPRKQLKVFANQMTTDDCEEFGSTAIAATNYTKDIATIQTLDAWVNGWRSALVTAKAPILQDMNAVNYVHSYMLGSIFEEGIPEYDAATSYAAGSVVRLPYTGGNNFQIFVSLADANVGNALPTAPASNAHWQFVFGFVSGVFTMGTALAFGDTSTEGIVGATDGGDAAVGAVGQTYRQIASGSAVSSNSWQNACSQLLPAGDYWVNGQVESHLNGATQSGFNIATSLFSGNTITDHVAGDNQLSMLPPNSSVDSCMTIAGWRTTFNSPTTVYLKVNSVYGAGTPQWLSRLSILRIR